MFKKQFRAFTLIEIALSIAIAGIAVSCIAPIWQTIAIAKKQRANEEKFHYIRVAMQAYIIRYGHLPFAANNLDGMASDMSVRGFVPYKTLGLQKQYALDCNGKPFTFVVNKNLIKLPDRNYIPMIKHANSCIKLNDASFCRLYSPLFFKKDLHAGQSGASNESLVDQVCNLENLVILENGESVIEKTDYYYVLTPVAGLSSQAGLWVNWNMPMKANNPARKVCNTIAWLIVSHGPVSKKTTNKKISACKKMNDEEEQKFCILPTKDDGGLFNDTIFYQTRFDMAAQAGFPCTCDPAINLNG